PCQPAAASPHGRADRRHGGTRARRPDGIDRRDRPRAPHWRALHRARYGCRLRPCPSRDRARPRPRHRVRFARCRAQRPGGARGLSRLGGGCRLMTALRQPSGATVQPLLALTGVDAYYGLAQILFEVSFAVGIGEVVALLGRNGAGKSTTLKSIAGLLSVAKGEIAMAGRRIDRLPSNRISRLGIGYVPEDRRIFTDLTVDENLEVGRQEQREGAPHWTKERLFALFPNLASMRNRPGGRMSGGEQQMLTIARTMMGNPRLLLLDEPSEGLAPKIVEQMADTVLRLKSEGLTVVLSEQNLHFAMLSDRAVILEKGRVRYVGPMAELAHKEDVQRTYLGA